MRPSDSDPHGLTRRLKAQGPLRQYGLRRASFWLVCRLVWRQQVDPLLVQDKCSQHLPHPPETPPSLRPHCFPRNLKRSNSAQQTEGWKVKGQKVSPSPGFSRKQPEAKLTRYFLIKACYPKEAKVRKKRNEGEKEKRADSR